MREASLISELRGALRRRGVWGSRADRLLQEWTEHVRDDAAQRIEKGAEPEAARDAAWQALGGADVLAASAARELAQASWLGRHPWLGGAALPMLCWVVVVAAVIATPTARIYMLLHGGLDHPGSANFLAAWGYWQSACNWLPWLFSTAWLAWIAARMPGGWKLYWVTAVALTLFSTSFQVAVLLRLHGPGFGHILFYWPTGTLGIPYAIAHALGFKPILRSWARLPSPEQTRAWIQTAIMLAGAMTFHFKAAAREAAVQGEVRHA